MNIYCARPFFVYVFQILIMHKAKHGESDKGKDKQKGTLSELNVSPEDVVAAKLNLKWLYTRGESTVDINE